MPKEALLVDIISDLHLDMYTSLRGKESIDIFVNRFFKKDGEVLIIAGDLTHRNTELPELFSRLGEKYEKILVVAGNHDFYLLHDYTTPDELYSNDRYQNLLKSCYADPKVRLLNCEYYDYKGFTFFGMIGWYDGSYNTSYTNSQLNNLWRSVMNDSRKIRFRGEDNLAFDDMHKREKIKIENIKELRPADVFISHVNPYSNGLGISHEYINDPATAFYTFDGSYILDKLQPKLVAHGHTHKPHNTVDNGRTIICNPLGYPWEDNGVKSVKRITLKKEIK